MGWRWQYWKENVSRTFHLWEKHEAVSVLAGMVIAAIPSAGFGYLASVVAGYGLVVAFSCWFGFLLLVITPMKMWKERTDNISELTGKRLMPTDAEVYHDDKRHWIRLRVENQAAIPIRGCYGKLLERRNVSFPCVENGIPIQAPISREIGKRSMENQQLPPEGHRFTWSIGDDRRETTTVPGHSSPEYLYVVTKDKEHSDFAFCAHSGAKYENWGMGDFELELEIGSEIEAFKPTRARLVFRAVGPHLEFVSLDVHQDEVQSVTFPERIKSLYRKLSAPSNLSSVSLNR